MTKICLTATNSEGATLKAIFETGNGLNLVAFSLDEIQIIDERKNNFIIGPHFGHRKLFSKDKPEMASDPFVNGVASHAPWTITSSDSNSFKAIIKGKDVWNEKTLAELQGQDFVMRAEAYLSNEGLFFKISIVSDTASLVGVSTAYYVPENTVLFADVQPFFIENGIKFPLEPSESYKERTLNLDLSKNSAYTLWPKDPCSASLCIANSRHEVLFTYNAICAENSFQIERQTDENLLAIHAMSSFDPLHPNLSASHLSFGWQIKKVNNSSS